MFGSAVIATVVSFSATMREDDQHPIPESEVMLRILFCVLALSQFVIGQVQLEWRSVSPTTAPLAREHHEMVFDAYRGHTVLFGGRNGSSYYNDTWIYDAKGWRRLTPTSSPAPRADHTMTYDPIRGRVVLMGGTDGKPFDDIWEWDGKNWSRVATGVRNVGPGGASCYDPVQGGVFFNVGSVNILWDGKTANYLTAQSATGGTLHRMVYDSGSGGPFIQKRSYTRRFRPGTGWGLLGTTHFFDLSNYAMAVDSKNGRVILQGGEGSVGSSHQVGFEHTWMWTGRAWSPVAPTNWRGRSRHAMAFDVIRGVFVMFGGTRNGNIIMNETWELHDVTMRGSYHVFGSGCSGTTSLKPTLGLDPLLGGPPLLGGTLNLRASGLPLSMPALLAFGASDKSWGALRLPLSLAAIGMPGCNLYVSLDIVQVGATSSALGEARWTIHIPNDSRVIGAKFFNQVAVAAPAANPSGILWTNGGAGVIGTR